MTKLHRVKSLSEKEALEEVSRKFLREDSALQSRIKVSQSDVVGQSALHWYRGKHVGTYEAYLTLKEKYPEAAKALLEAHGMDENGNI